MGKLEAENVSTNNEDTNENNSELVPWVPSINIYLMNTPKYLIHCMIENGCA